MALLNNPYIIDIIIGLFLIIYTFIGYLKGFIIRLYDFFSLFIAYFLTINFSFPLSKLITLYQLEGLLEPIGIKVNQLLVAVILFIVIYFLLKGIGVLLKPFLNFPNLPKFFQFPLQHNPKVPLLHILAYLFLYLTIYPNF